MTYSAAQQTRNAATVKSRNRDHFIAYINEPDAKGTIALSLGIPVDKYLHSKEDNTMHTFDHQDDLIFDDRLDTQRDIIRQSLDAIANDIG